MRELYPSTSKYARRGIGNSHRDAPLPEPTSTPPGTPEKVAVMAERAQAGLALFHPLDATAGDLEEAAQKPAGETGDDQ